MTTITTARSAGVPRPRKTSPGRSLVHVVGELMITLGVVMLLLVVYQLFWTNIESNRKAHQIVAGKVDLGGRGRVQFAGQIAREDRAVHRLVAQLDANLGAVAIDEVCRLPPANQGHVVTRHQELRRQQRAIRGPKDQNVMRHVSSSRCFV